MWSMGKDIRLNQRVLKKACVKPITGDLANSGYEGVQKRDYRDFNGKQCVSHFEVDPSSTRMCAGVMWKHSHMSHRDDSYTTHKTPIHALL